VSAVINWGDGTIDDYSNVYNDEPNSHHYNGVGIYTGSTSMSGTPTEPGVICEPFHNTFVYEVPGIPQTITFTSTVPMNAVVGGTYVVSATGGGSGNPVVFSVQGGGKNGKGSADCTISGATVTFTAVGTCTIDANQAGNASYNPAPTAQQQVPVGAALIPQTIAFTSTAKNPVIGGTYDVSATGGASGNPVTFSIDTSTSSICTIAGSTVTFDAVGTCLVDANQLGDANYLAAPQAQQPVAVTAIPQAQKQSYGTAENTALSEAAESLQAGVVDLNPTATSWTAAEVAGPSHGSLTVNADGAFTYTPGSSFTGTDSFTYTLTDKLGYTSAPATVTITVSTSCKVDAWPKKITRTSTSDPGSPSTYYIGEVNGAFTLFAEHPENNKDVNETGTITIGPKSSDVFLSNLRGKKNENTGGNVDSEHLVNQWTIQFSFHTFKSLDGLYFSASCGSTLSFSLKANNGTGTALKKTPPKQIHLGKPTSSPATDPFTETR